MQVSDSVLNSVHGAPSCLNTKSLFGELPAVNVVLVRSHSNKH